MNPKFYDLLQIHSKNLDCAQISTQKYGLCSKFDPQNDDKSHICYISEINCHPSLGLLVIHPTQLNTVEKTKFTPMG